MTDSLVIEKSDPEEVFAALSDDTRIEIIRALSKSEGHEATFSELRESVGMRDSGQFNYHLDKLVGRFIAKSEGGYELTQSGKQISGAIEAGAYTMEGSIDPISLDDPCSTCGDSLTFRYENEGVAVDCDGCPVSYRFLVPPGVFEGYERDEIPTVANRYFRTTFDHITSGFCWFCDGRMERTVGSTAEISGQYDDSSDEWNTNFEEIPSIRYDCKRCGAKSTAGLDLVLLDHPAVIGFYFEHGIDVREQPIWNVTAMDHNRARITNRDPLQAELVFTAGEDRLQVTVDEDLSVVDIES